MVILARGEKINKSFCPSRRFPYHLKHYIISIALVIAGVVVAAGYAGQSSLLVAGVVLSFLLGVIIILLGIAAWVVSDLLRISQGKFYITNQRIIAQRGIIRTTTDVVSYGLIVNVKVHQSLWDKLVKIGRVEIITARGRERGEIDMDGVSGPHRIENLIYKHIETPHHVQEVRYYSRPTRRLQQRRSQYKRIYRPRFTHAR